MADVHLFADGLVVHAVEIAQCQRFAVVAWQARKSEVELLIFFTDNQLPERCGSLIWIGFGFDGSSGHADLDSEFLGLCEVVDAVGAPVVLLGGCEAAVVPIAIAARYPERVQALIIVNGTARFAGDGNYPGTGLGTLQATASTVRVNWEGFFRPFFSNDAPIPWTDINSLFELLRQFVTGEAMAAIFDGIIQADVRQEITKIAAPTLVIHSTEDEVIPYAQAQYLAAHIAGAKLHALHGASHHVDPSYNDEIAETIREFLTGIPGEATNVQPKGKLATMWGSIKAD